jgi:Zn-dependent protease
VFSGSNIQLARVFGIRIGVDASWFFVLFLIIWSLSGYYQDLFPANDTKAYALAVVSALLFFLSVLLHELGHAVVAIRSGIPISGITLWMFGGMAQLERDTETPGQEFKIAVAGPLVTLVIAAACFAGGSLIASGGDVWSASRFEDTTVGAATAVLGYLAFVNAVVLAFNLIPGFPLDGGRIARAIAWWRTGDRNKATRFAARLGRIAGFGMIGVGAYLFLFNNDFVSGIWLAFIGLFLGQAARSAELSTTISDRLEGLRVADVMDAEPVAVPEDLTLDRAEDEFFLRYHDWPWFPVVDTSGRLVGVVTREAVESVPEPVRPSRPVASVMARDDGASGLRVDVESPLEAVLAAEGLGRLGALLAVDGNGILRGVVTADRLRRTLRPATP